MSEVIDVQVPVAEATQALEAPAPEATAAPTESATAETTPEPEKTLKQSEVDKIVQREKARTERRVERAIRAEVENEFLRKQLQTPQADVTQSGEPKPEQFKDWDSYNSARVDYLVEQKLSKQQQESQAQSQARMAQEQAERVRSNLSKAEEKYDDFNEVALSDKVPITGSMAMAIAESEIGGELAYYLGSHIDEAEKISKLSPIKQVVELSKLEQKLAMPAPKTSTAPPPARPFAGSKASVTDISKMSMAEYKEFRKQQGARWA